MSTTKRPSFSDDAKLAIGATGAIVAIDQVEHAIDSEEHQLNHALKAAVGAAVAIGAFELLRRDDNSAKQSNKQPKPKSTARSGSPRPEHHDRHLVEEVLGAYALGKELLGDKKHHIAHLVGEAIGATGLLQELTAKEKDGVKEKDGAKK
jgi:hypothetical protein